MRSRLTGLLAGAVFCALVGASPALAGAQYPYTLVDPGTFGGPNSELNLPGFPITPEGALIGSADTSIPDTDFPNVNPFPVSFPDSDIAHAFLWQNGHLRDLGALPGNNSSAVFQVNQQGVGVGLSEVADTDPFTGWPSMHAVLFKDGHVVDLGTLPGGHEALALGIDAHGQVSGFSANATADPFANDFFGPDTAWSRQIRTFVWHDGVMRDIGTLGGTDALMNAANASGQITGQSFTNSTVNPATGYPTLDPFLWTRGHMRDLGSLGGAQGVANWLNNHGEVVGQSDLPGDRVAHAFVSQAGRLRDLGTLGGDFSGANYVSQSGDIAGWSTLRGDHSFDGVLWRRGRKIDLPPVGGAPNAFGNAVNDHGQVVGNETNGDFNEIIAALWSGGHGYDLNTLVAPQRLQLTSAEWIDDRGDIVAHGVGPDGAQRMFLLIPNPGVPLPRVSTAAAARARRNTATRHRIRIARIRWLWLGHRR
jgi:probable HAF family extracellular repeat protein